MNEKYVPLYRKYRPQRIEEIVGQEHIKKALSNAITSGKVSHAYLFTGPRGTGKTSAARIFAKSLNCENGPTVNPCGKCPNCVDITNSVPIDVIEIDAASNRKVEDAQNILEKVMYAPVKSKYKIYIIDEVHMLSNTAFNALLKTLEEPPANVIFILATTEVHKVLDTIKSRCPRFDFRRITTEDITKHLRYISDKEGINITDDALTVIAKNSAGGMRDSIALLDQLSILNGDVPISVDDINSLLGRLSFELLHKLAEGIVNSNPQLSIETLDLIYNSGNEPALILLNLLDYFKSMLIVKTCSTEISMKLTQLNEEQISDISLFAVSLETHQITSLIDLIAEYIKKIKSSANPKLWMEVCIIDMANLAENTKLADINNRLLKLEGSPAGNSPNVFFHKIQPKDVKENIKNLVDKSISPKEEPVNNINTVVNNNVNEKPVEEIPQEIKQEEFSPMPKAKHLGPDDISVLWGKLLSNIQSVPTVTLLKQWANPVKITPEETVISIKTELFLNRIGTGNKKELIVNAVNELFSQQNSNVIIRLPLPEDTNVSPVAPKPQAVSTPQNANNEPVDDAPTESEIQEITQQEIQETAQQSATYNEHSDQVNMIVDLFEGKIID